MAAGRAKRGTGRAMARHPASGRQASRLGGAALVAAVVIAPLVPRGGPPGELPWRQGGLGHRSGLSGKFIGEVERGEKSISIDSLYRVSVALEVPLRDLTDVRADKEKAVPSEEAEKIFALVTGRRRPEDIRKAYDVLRAMFGKAS